MSYEASKNLQDLIENILDFSKIEQGKIELNKTNFNLKNLLDEIIENYKMKNENNVDINFDYNSEIDVFYADKVKIYQIINNIFGNDYNHTESGYISLKFKSEKHLNDEYKLCFTIEDTGKGISEENLEKIFKEFYQVYSENQRNYSGVGLGLPISKKLIEMMDGEINVESLIDKGTKINFSFFVEKGQLHNEKKTGFAKILFNNNKVLLVEDNKVNQEIQKRILQNYDLNVDVVDNGQEAVEIIENNPNKYEIIFMDISMPVMNGFEAISYLRNEVSENKFKIIALTAFTSSIDRKKVFDFGFDDFIPKPIEENELLRILKKFLKDEKQNQNKIENITKNKDILDLFIKDLEEKIPLIENYYDEMNYGKMSEIFHQIKNPFKYLKYEEMYEVAKELEKVAKNNDKNEIKVLYPEFKEKIEDFIKENKE
jgi:CheY-like chemotaxis protein/anti-sigma regulatory factor (Ser/Thr protein kinase)